MIQDILAAQFAQYPLMEPQDAVKLVYQHIFGPEHMIRSPERALSNLIAEMETLLPRAGEEALYEPIGNGLCRLNLRPCVTRGIPAQDVNRLFAETANAAKGDKKQFRLALRALQEMAEGEETPFEAIELELFLSRYPDSCPALHHSDAYRAAYAPAYRVVSQRKLKDYLADKRKNAPD